MTPTAADLPPIPCAGGCGRQIWSRYDPDWCEPCFLVHIQSSKSWPKRTLRTAEPVTPG